MWSTILCFLSLIVYSLQDTLKCQVGGNLTGTFNTSPKLTTPLRHLKHLIDESILCGGPPSPTLLPTTGGIYLVSCGCTPCNLSLLPNGPSYVILSNQKDETNKMVTFTAENVSPAKLSEYDECIIEPSVQAASDSADALRSFSKTSVLFVSISFIILMVISLAWLVFYYVQRFRYAHAKDRLQRRLFNAAKKALARIPARSLRNGDSELDTDCPVCIDPYAAGDVVRTLPCRHVFHKTCIDPWLLEHRTCPMCKGDILKAFGYQVSCGGEGSREEERGNGRDVESPDPPSTASESGVFPFHPNNEIHDPFNFTPSSSPQLVLNNSNAKNFQIVPLTVHSKPPSATSREVVVEVPPTTVTQDKRGERASSASEPGPSAVRGVPTRGQSQGQLVNLVQVRSRSASVVRAATFRGRVDPSSPPANTIEGGPSTESI